MSEIKMVDISTPIIFLDIDGVLNNDTDDIIWLDNDEYGYGFYSPVLISHLNKITDATGAKLVLSSTWRLGKEIDELVSMLAAMGITGDLIGKTDYLSQSWACRGNEIDKWIREHIDGLYYNYKSWVIIDDDSDMLYTHRKNFVQTHGLVGLTDKLADDAIQIIKTSPDHIDPNVEYVMEYNDME